MGVVKFKKMMADLPIKSENGQKNYDSVEQKLKGIKVGIIEDIHLPPDTGGYMLAVYQLSKKYAVVEPILIGKYLSLFYCKKFSKRNKNASVHAL